MTTGRERDEILTEKFSNYFTKINRESQSHECGIYKDDIPIDGMSSFRKREIISIEEFSLLVLTPV